MLEWASSPSAGMFHVLRSSTSVEDGKLGVISAHQLTSMGKRLSGSAKQVALSRGDRTPLELFLSDIRCCEVGLRRRMEDGRPFLEYLAAALAPNQTTNFKSFFGR